MISCCYFILGACLASFAGLVGFRLRTCETPWAPRRSYCDHCHCQLRCWQLIPILGWLLQRGRCIHCQAPISPFLPVTEAFAGLAATLLCGDQLLFSTIFLLIITSLVILASSDYFHQFILPVFILGLSPLFFLYHPTWSPIDILLASGDVVIFTILTFKFRSLGSGDWEFLLMVILTLGWYNTALVTFLACASSFPAFRLTRIPLMPGLALGMGATLIWLKETGALP